MNHMTDSQTRILSAIPTLVSALLLVFAAAAHAQTPARATQAQPQAKVKAMTMQAVPAGTAELSRFCDPSTVTTSSRGGKTLYNCTSKPGGSSSDLKARPRVARSKITCEHSESGGVTTWLGCSCTADEGGNCNTFITNCVEDGDTVGGNSGSASCKPSGG
jgi:hypothetical protein